MRECAHIYGLRANGSDLIMYVGKCKTSIEYRLTSHLSTAIRTQECLVQRWIESCGGNINAVKIADVTEALAWNAFERAAIGEAASDALYRGYVITNQQMNPFRYKNGLLNEEAMFAHMVARETSKRKARFLIELAVQNDKHLQPTGGAR